MVCHEKLVIGIPAFNEELYLPTCLEALMDQTVSEFRVLISDNASADGTETIARDAVKRDERFYYVRHSENMGAARNVRFLRDVTGSPFFMWLGAHDAVVKDYIEKQLLMLESDASLALVYSPTDWIDESGRRIRTSDGGRFVSETSSGLKRYVAAARGPFDECTAVNGIFRRRAIEAVDILPIAGSDHLILVHAQFHGSVVRNCEVRYLRREFKQRASEYMERIVGKKGEATTRLRSRRKMMPVAVANIKDYVSLPSSMPEKVLMFPLLILNLYRAYGHFGGRIYRFVCRLIRRTGALG